MNASRSLVLLMFGTILYACQDSNTPPSNEIPLHGTTLASFAFQNGEGVISLLPSSEQITVTFNPKQAQSAERVRR